MTFGFKEAYRDYFKGKVVLITGGLGGIGFATAKRFKEYGATVVVTDVKNPDETQESEMKIQLEGLIHFIQADGTQQEEAERVVAQVVTEHGKIDVLFNNMGIGANTPGVMQRSEEVEQEDFEKVLKTNLMSYVWFTSAVLPHMRAQKSGAILFSSSTWASGLRDGSPAYSIAKAGVNKLAETIHFENQKNEDWKNIRVHAIEWPAVDTPIGEKAVTKLTTSEAADITVAAAAGEWDNGETIRPKVERDEKGEPIVTTKEEEEKKKTIKREEGGVVNQEGKVIRPKAVVLDLDGTTIPNRQDGMPSDRVADTVQRVNQGGDTVCVATGRSIEGSREIFKRLGLTSPCIINGGAQIVDPVTESVLWEQAMDDGQRQQVESVIQKYNLPSNASGASIIRVEPVKAEHVEAVLAELRAVPNIAAHKVAYWEPGTFGIHVTHKDATKQHAMEVLLEMLELQKNDVVAIGDSNNDVPLFVGAGYKVAMGNGSELLKKKADHVTRTVEEDGVAVVLEELFPPKKSDTK